jgi:hypothetical protein
MADFDATRLKRITRDVLAYLDGDTLFACVPDPLDGGGNGKLLEIVVPDTITNVRAALAHCEVAL